MTEFAACHTCAQAVVAYANGIIFEAVGKVVFSLCHRSNEHADAFAWRKRVNVVSDSYYLGVEAECDFSATWRKVVRDGILDDLEKLFLGIDRSNGQTMKKLHHQACKSFESSRYPDSWADFDEDTFSCMYKDLELSSFVDRRVKERKEALHRQISICCVEGLIEKDLVCYIRPSFANVSAHLAHDANMFVAVQ